MLDLCWRCRAAAGELPESLAEGDAEDDEIVVLSHADGGEERSFAEDIERDVRLICSGCEQ